MKANPGPAKKNRFLCYSYFNRENVGFNRTGRSDIGDAHVIQLRHETENRKYDETGKETGQCVDNTIRNGVSKTCKNLNVLLFVRIVVRGFVYCATCMSYDRKCYNFLNWWGLHDRCCTRRTLEFQRQSTPERKHTCSTTVLWGGWSKGSYLIFARIWRP